MHLRSVLWLLILATPAFADGDARKSAKFLKPTKAPFQTHYPRGCGPRDDVVAHLTGPKWREALATRDIARGQIIAETWRGPESWSWTITTENMMCVVNSGGRAPGENG